MTESHPPDPTDPAPAPSSLSRAELLDLCASLSLDGSAGAADTGERGGDALEHDAVLQAAVEAAGITRAEIAARRARFAATRDALLDGDEGPAGESDDDLDRARRTRAVRSAIAVAIDDPPVGDPMDAAGRDQRSGTAQHGRRPAAVDSPGGDRLRRITVAAAAVLVVAGIGGLALGGLGSRGSEDTAGSAAETADATAGGASDGSEIGAGSSTTAAPSDDVAADAPRAESFAGGSGWVDLGPVASAEAALERWRALAGDRASTDTDGQLPATSRAEIAASAPAQRCVAQLGTDGVAVVGTAEIPRGLVVLTIVEGTSTVQVVEVVSCSVLASAPIG